MKLRVYHNTNFLDFEKFRYDKLDTVYLQKNYFRWVATLWNACSLEDGFEYTQNGIFEDSWVDNERVTPIVYKPKRSTSVGDVIENADTGELFVVMPFGFNKFEWC